MSLETVAQRGASHRSACQLASCPPFSGLLHAEMSGTDSVTDAESVFRRQQRGHVAFHVGVEVLSEQQDVTHQRNWCAGLVGYAPQLQRPAARDRHSDIAEPENVNLRPDALDQLLELRCAGDFMLQDSYVITSAGSHVCSLPLLIPNRSIRVASALKTPAWGACGGVVVR